jgi:YYY domain-containing protein
LVGIEAQVAAVVIWLVLIKLLQLSLWPLLREGCGRFAYPVSFTGSVLAYTLLSWYCGLIHLPVWVALLPFGLLLIYHLFRREYTPASLAGMWRWDLVFLGFFLFMLEARYTNPSISYAEKFMDHGFIASVMRNPVVPPLDPWYAGGNQNVYYYLGYWLIGSLGAVTGIPSSVVFNLALPTIMGLAAVNLYAIGDLLLKRLSWLPVGVLLLPNPSAFLLSFGGADLSKVAWDSTRVITDTINEYPLFSFTWGDVHAHVLGIFNQVFLIFLLLLCIRTWKDLTVRGRGVLMLLVAVSLGSMPGINSWDVLIYAPITLGVCLYLVWQERQQGAVGILQYLPLVMPALAVAAYLPFYLQMSSAGIKGIGIVQIPSAPVQFLLVHGFFLLVFYAFSVRDLVKRPYLLAAAIPFLLTGYYAAAIAVIPLVSFATRKVRHHEELLAVCGLLVALFCEILYLKDNMGDQYFRMNTVFKFYVAAWLLMGSASAVMIGRAFDESRLSAHLASLGDARVKGAAVLLVIVLLVTPFAVTGKLTAPDRTLDGLAYLETTHPGDAAAVAFLSQQKGSPVIVEAQGSDYTYAARVSSFTGLPAIVGWTFHEYMWRGDYGPVSERMADVKAIYQEPIRTVALMKKYNATLLYVGETERATYQVSLPTTGLRQIYSAQGVQIYQLA